MPLRRRIAFIGWLLLLLWGSMGVHPLRARPAAGFESTGVHTYGAALEFTLMWETADSVTAVALLLQPVGETRPYRIDAPLTDASTSVRQTVAPAALDLLPFQSIRYWWEVTTAAGDGLTVSPQELVYADNRYTWQTATDGRFHVYWTGQEAPIGTLALASLAQSAAQLEALFGQPDFPTALYVYPSTADLTAMLRLHRADLQGLMTAGSVDPSLGVMLITAVNQRTAAADLARTIPEELARHTLYRLSDAPQRGQPFWLQAGVATLAQPVLDPALAGVIETAVAQNALIPFSDLCRPADAAARDLTLASAQSAAFVNYLHAALGSVGMRRLAAATGDCEAGLAAISGRSLAAWEAAWLASVQGRTPVVQIILEHGIWLLLLLSGSFLAAGLILK